MSAGKTIEEQLAEWVPAAHALGVAAALAAASWITDGNESDASRRQKLESIENEQLWDLITPPDLSGEWAPYHACRSLFEDVTGLDSHAEASWNADAYGTVVDALSDAWEAGVDDTFEDACVAELNRWLS